MNRDARNKRVWDNYDNWKLASPPEFDLPEVYETDIYLEQSWFSCDEDLIQEFEERAEKCKKEYKNDFNRYEESIYDIVDDLNLAYDDSAALVQASEDERDAYEASEEEKADHAREMRRDKES